MHPVWMRNHNLEIRLLLLKCSLFVRKEEIDKKNSFVAKYGEARKKNTNELSPGALTPKRPR